MTRFYNALASAPYFLHPFVLLKIQKSVLNKFFQYYIFGLSRSSAQDSDIRHYRTFEILYRIMGLLADVRIM